MEYTKRIVELDVHYADKSVTVPMQSIEEGISTPEVRIPYHSIRMTQEKVSFEHVIVYDETKALGCKYIPDPKIYGGDEPLEATPGQEFDPTEDVTAYDGNGKKLTISVELENENED